MARSPDLVFFTHGLLFIYRPQRDGRLSWPSWLTHNRQFTYGDRLLNTDRAQGRKRPTF